MVNEELLMELADCGSPVGLAQIIHQTMERDLCVAVNVEQVAKTVGIETIDFENIDGFEGILVADENKTVGRIVVNSNSPEVRQRFTIAHEIGHFLIPTHDEKTSCTLSDGDCAGSNRRKSRQENEADEFAAELLMPSKELSRLIGQKMTPDVDDIIDMARKYNVSKEAMVRQYVALTDFDCAMIFGLYDRARYYPYKTKGFPFIDFGKDDPLPPHITEMLEDLEVGETTEWYPVDPHFFFAEPSDIEDKELYAQSYLQENGYNLTMLSLEDD